jgi:hypothetical protein
MTDVADAKFDAIVGPALRGRDSGIVDLARAVFRAGWSTAQESLRERAHVRSVSCATLIAELIIEGRPTTPPIFDAGDVEGVLGHLDEGSGR